MRESETKTMVEYGVRYPRDTWPNTVYPVLDKKQANYYRDYCGAVVVKRTVITITTHTDWEATQ